MLHLDVQWKLYKNNTMKFFLIFALILISFISVVSCSKEDFAEPADAVSEEANTAENSARRPRSFYGDTIFHQRGLMGNYFITVKRRPAAPGYFKAIPLGLSLDSTTGRININKSESGLRYKVYYLSPSGARIDSSNIVISGIDYKDGIYTLGDGLDTAYPIYNANPNAGLPCDDDDDDDDDKNADDDDCIFDETDLNNNGSDDIAGVNPLGFLVNKSTGVLDLAGSLSAGALGASPVNGANAEYEFYYRLNDFSNLSLQKIKVKLYYYEDTVDIPQSLLDTLALRQTQDQSVNNLLSGLGQSQYVMEGTRQIFAAAQPVYARAKRPPIIIITIR